MADKMDVEMKYNGQVVYRSTDERAAVRKQVTNRVGSLLNNLPTGTEVDLEFKVRTYEESEVSDVAASAA